jgi:hypothetical protein
MQTSLEQSQTAMRPFVANGQNFAPESARLQAHAFSTMMQYQIEALKFLKHRYEEDVKLANDLVASSELTTRSMSSLHFCRTPRRNTRLRRAR